VQGQAGIVGERGWTSRRGGLSNNAEEKKGERGGKEMIGMATGLDRRSGSPIPHPEKKRGV